MLLITQAGCGWYSPAPAVAYHFFRVFFQPLMTSKNDKPDNDARLETQLNVLRELETNPAVSQRQLARHLGVSLGSVNYCLRALVDKGFVKAENFRNNPAKAQYLYLLTPSGLSEKTRLTLAFLERKQADYHRLQNEIENLKGELNERG